VAQLGVDFGSAPERQSRSAAHGTQYPVLVSQMSFAGGGMLHEEKRFGTSVIPAVAQTVSMVLQEGMQAPPIRFPKSSTTE
jgi:hypothetical protein